MSMFPLAISCLTTSNFPWFMDLTFQAAMQYCSLQHQTLLPSPVTSTTGCCCCFGSASSFFLELFLHWSPVAYWAPTDLGNSSFSVFSFLPFYTVHRVLKARILKWFAIPFSSGPCFVRNFHHDPSVLGSPTPRWMGHGGESPIYTIYTIYIYHIYTIYTIFSPKTSFPGGSVIKNLPANARDTSSIPESGRFPGEGNGCPL